MRKLTNSLTALGCAALLAVSSSAAAFAAQNVYTDGYVLTDDANLFTESEATGLTDKMATASSKTGWQIIVHTDTYGASSGSMTSHYDDYYYSDSTFKTDAVMLVFDTGSDNRIILTYGRAQKYFSDSVLGDVKSAMKPYLESGDNIGAATAFVDQMERAYNAGYAEDNSSSTTTTTEKRNPFLTSLSRWWIYLLIALAVFGIFILVNRSRYKNMGKSGTYDLKKNSQLRLTDQQDVIVDRRTTYTTINTSSGSSGSSGDSGGHSSGSF